MLKRSGKKEGGGRRRTKGNNAKRNQKIGMPDPARREEKGENAKSQSLRQANA
jgi:hypothetical protein